jgi:hypothetical protein
MARSPSPPRVASKTTGMRTATCSSMVSGAVRASTTRPSHRPAILSTRPPSWRWWLAAMSTAYPLRRAARSMPRITSSYQYAASLSSSARSGKHRPSTPVRRAARSLAAPLGT